ncbi:hypothetical protein HPB48_021515 [Haemaphysalis longicornis]|uniref:THAP-type domain-containing protein n=1 Tax=Haemaphysalis longicornis TaxID=44386 RepID=A0A9J6GBL5_HAELO|nr:hypothetical protein HPB48_021515 [Haemaphysalis longicornis]
MPRNCCVPLCDSNAKKDAGLRYHEFPSNSERREAWLKNGSCEGLTGKRSKWQPSDWLLVGCRHFTQSDYRTNARVGMLLPTAVPTVFPNYPEYMQKGTAKPRKRHNCNSNVDVGRCLRENSSEGITMKWKRSFLADFLVEVRAESRF